jgi:uncharacterized protein (DUF1501 family)
MTSRRECLKYMAAGMMVAGFPMVSFAGTDKHPKLVLVILRGAVDGLGMLAPYADPAYAGLRGELALAKPGMADGALELDGFFGLHPALKHVHAMYQNGEALPLHAIASPYRQRSHFDAQNLLENGTTKPGGRRDGWLNRALKPLSDAGSKDVAIAMAQNTPLVLRGEQSVTSWSPSILPDADEQTLERIRQLYEKDEFFASRLQQALDSQEIAGNEMGSKRRQNKVKQYRELMQATARFLRAANGPRVAVIESSGWDTHQNQGGASGGLANRLKDLDGSLNEFRLAMGEEWSTAVVMLVTEFGRTVRVNGTRGTDHGTGTAALLLGGAVNGGRVIADWPGLTPSALYEGRDLQPTMDYRSLFKGVLADHLQVSPSFLDKHVFPDSKGAKRLRDLIRT